MAISAGKVRTPPKALPRLSPVLAALLCVVLYHLPVSADTPSTPLQVFLLAGQSNMQGRLADGSQLPPELQQPQQDVRYRDGGPSEPRPWDLLGPKDWIGPAFLDPSFGPEVTFGRTVADGMPDRQVALIKFSVDGTPISSWNPDYDLSRSGAQYPRMVELVNTAMADLANEGVSAEFAGFVWVQGESDALDVEEDALAYESRLTYLIQSVREDLASPNLPAVIARVYPSSGYLYADEVQAAQAAVNTAVPHTALVDTDDLTLTDLYHYDASGQMTLGERLAEAYLQHLRGDINGDGFTTAADADTLLANLGSTDPLFDTNDDGISDANDLAYFVQAIAGTSFGDLDLSGDVTTAEAASVVGNLGLMGATFVDGDQNGNGTVDFIEAATAVANINTAAQPLAIPEPASLSLIVLAAIWLRRPRG